jgi:hypothetical protein
MGRGYASTGRLSSDRGAQRRPAALKAANAIICGDKLIGMAQIPRCVRFFRKAEAALLASIELYNKPDFRYREEAFAILVLNAWELLLKAKLLAENRNRVACLAVFEKRQTKTGTLSKKLYVKKNRSGNSHSIGLGPTIVALETKGIKMSQSVKRNLDGLVEVRDNAVHFINASPRLSKNVLELGTACVKNFIELAKTWFALDLSAYNLYLMPIGFVAAPGSATAIAASNDEERLLRYLAGLVKDSGADTGTDFHVALEVSLSFKRSPVDAAAVVAVTNDPAAPKVSLSEEDVRKLFPWDYRELTKRLKSRYLDFKEAQKYHDIRKPLMADPKLVKSRYLDPGNAKSPRKDFYNPNILAEFDKHYTRREGKAA